MKITFLAPHLKVSGGIRIILTYAGLLSSRGHDVKVVVPTGGLRNRIKFALGLKRPHWIKNFNSKILPVSSFNEKNIPYSDVAIATSIKTTLAATKLSDSKGKKFYLIQHDEGLYHGSREEADESYRLPLGKIVVSSWLKNVMEARFGSPAELLLNPTDREQFRPLGRTIDKESIRVLLLHHNYEWKGTKEGVEIIKELKQKHSNIKLILFGARSRDIDVEADEYHFNLPQEKLAWLYSNSDIFLCPSWDEGSGLPAMEAMACKCAVVTYDNGGSRDYAFDGRTALVAERRNMEQLKDKLRELIENRGLREQIAENGYQQVLLMPTWEEQVSKLEKIFQGD